MFRFRRTRANWEHQLNPERPAFSKLERSYAVVIFNSAHSQGGHFYCYDSHTKLMRQCAFCRSTKLTREHIWSDWINRVLHPTVYTVRRKTSEHGSFTQWRTAGLQQTAKVVCKQCNNGWMNQLEQYEAKPAMADMIRYGRAMSILPNGISSIAKFAFKMTVIANHIALTDATPYFSIADRYRFAQTLELPPGLQMWLFALNTPGRVTGKLNSHLGRAPIEVKHRFELYICTFAIGYLGVQVIHPRWVNPNLSAFIRFPGLRPPSEWDSATVEIWPNSGKAVLWPPPLHLGIDSIDAFCNRWKHLDTPNWMMTGSLPS